MTWRRREGGRRADPRFNIRPRISNCKRFANIKEASDAFFEDKGLIPACRYHEVRFEELERDPVGQLRKVYQVLGLPDFGQVEPSVRRYVSSQAGYKKNAYPEITPETKARIVREWRRCLAEWNYPI